MGNIWSRAVEKQVEDDMEADPEVASTLVRVRRELREGLHGIAPFVGQHDSRSGGWTFGETFAFLQILHALGTGTVEAFTVPVGQSCHADKDWEENQATLSEGLASYPEFTALVYQNSPGNECDGHLVWDETVNFDHVPRPREGRRPSTRVDIGRAPLEIGTTFAATSWGHLVRERSLARWPYDHDEIMVMFATADFCNAGGWPGAINDDGGSR